jgi:hypothetical protein
MTKPVFAATPVENSWTSKAPMKVARYGVGVAVVNGKIYAIGGSTLSGGEGTWNGPIPYTGGTVGTNEEYDPETNTWKTKTPMPTPIQSFAIAAYKNKIYCMNGNLNEVYDSEADTWENKTPMPTPRGNIQANVVDGKIYLIGGETNGTLNEVYDPETDTWTTETPMPTASYSYSSAVVDKNIYIIDSNLNQIYDTVTDMWSQGAPSPSGITYGAAGATTGVNAPKLIYVLGEHSDISEGEPPYFVRVYDPEKDTWTFGADIPTHRYLFGVAVVNDMLYAIGGFTSSWSDDVLLNLLYGPGTTPHAANEQYTPFGYGTVPPEISVESPPHGKQSSNVFSLNFTVNKPVDWIGYSLDGQDNVTVTGNTTLAGLSGGLHNVTVYARDEFDNMGASEAISFNVEVPEPFPAILVAAFSVATVAVVGVGLMVYFKKRKR